MDSAATTPGVSGSGLIRGGTEGGTGGGGNSSESISNSGGGGLFGNRWDSYGGGRGPDGSDGDGGRRWGSGGVGERTVPGAGGARDAGGHFGGDDSDGPPLYSSRRSRNRPPDYSAGDGSGSTARVGGVALDAAAEAASDVVTGRRFASAAGAGEISGPQWPTPAADQSRLYHRIGVDGGGSGGDGSGGEGMWRSRSSYPVATPSGSGGDGNGGSDGTSSRFSSTATASQSIGPFMGRLTGGGGGGGGGGGTPREFPSEIRGTGGGGVHEEGLTPRRPPLASPRLAFPATATATTVAADSSPRGLPTLSRLSGIGVGGSGVGGGSSLNTPRGAGQDLTVANEPHTPLISLAERGLVLKRPGWTPTRCTTDRLARSEFIHT
jgi:hypothetical protein